MELWNIVEYATGLFLLFCMGGLILSPLWSKKKKERDEGTDSLPKPTFIGHPITVMDSADTFKPGCLLLGLRFTGDKYDLLTGTWVSGDIDVEQLDTWCAVVDQQGFLTACSPDDVERTRREMERVQITLNSRPAALELLLRDLKAQQKRSARLSHSRSPLRRQEAKALAEALDRTLTRLGSELSTGSCQVLFLPRLLFPALQAHEPLRCEAFDQLTAFPFSLTIEAGPAEEPLAATEETPDTTADLEPADFPETRKESTHETIGH